MGQASLAPVGGASGRARVAFEFAPDLDHVSRISQSKRISFFLYLFICLDIFDLFFFFVRFLRDGTLLIGCDGRANQRAPSAWEGWRVGVGGDVDSRGPNQTFDWLFDCVGPN